MSGQSDSSIETNRAWFRNNQRYSDAVASLDTYHRLRLALNEELEDSGRLLDIGNGGVFDYDIGLAGEITAVDLFLDTKDVSHYPTIKFVQGTALDLPFGNGEFDTIVVVMLLHHLTGRSCDESFQNVLRCLRECERCLRAGGKLVIAESCIPDWFFSVERLLFPVALRALKLVTTHPVTLQYTKERLQTELIEIFGNCHARHIPKGKRTLQFGYAVPSVVTPVQPYIFRSLKAPSL